METKGKTALPDDFHVTQDMRGWARTNCPGLDLDAVTAEFVDYCHARDWRMKDWVATWRNWCRTTAKKSSGRSYGAAPVTPPKPKPVEDIAPAPQQDAYQSVCNRQLMALIWREIAAGNRIGTDTLREAVRVKRRIAREMREMWGDRMNVDEANELWPRYTQMLVSALRGNLNSPAPRSSECATS